MVWANDQMTLSAKCIADQANNNESAITVLDLKDRHTVVACFGFIKKRISSFGSA